MTDETLTCRSRSDFSEGASKLNHEGRAADPTEALLHQVSEAKVASQAIAAMIALRRILIKEGSTEAIVSYSDKLLTRFSDSPDVWVFHITTLQMTNDRDRYLDVLKRGTEQWQSDDALNLKLAQASLKFGLSEAARTTATHAIEIASRPSIACAAYAVLRDVLVKEDRTDELIARGQALAARYPHHAAATLQLAIAFIQVNNIQSAKTLLLSAIELYPSEPELYMRLGEIHLKLKDHTIATAAFISCLELTLSLERLVRPLTLLRVALERMDTISRTGTFHDIACRKLTVLGQDPIHFWPFIKEYVLLCLKTGEFSNAEGALKDFRSWAAETTEVDYYLARVYFETGSFRKALDLFDKVADHYKNDIRFMQQYVHTLFKERRYADAELQALKALELEANVERRASLINHLSRIVARLLRFEDALNYQKELVVVQPRKIAYHRLLKGLMGAESFPVRRRSPEELLDTALEIIRRAPNNINGHLMALEVLSTSGIDDNEIEVRSHIAAEEFYQDREMLLLLGEHLHAFSKYDEARAIYQKCAALSSEHEHRLATALDQFVLEVDSGHPDRALVYHKEVKSQCTKLTSLGEPSTIITSGGEQVALCQPPELLVDRLASAASNQKTESRKVSSVTLVMVTNFTRKLVRNRHIGPPKTAMLELTFQSFEEKLQIPSNVQKVIFYDRPNTRGPDEDLYHQNVASFAHRIGASLEERVGYGLRRIMLDIYDFLKTDLVFHLEHDYELRSSAFEWSRCVQIFDDNACVNYLKLSSIGNFPNDYDTFMASSPTHIVTPYPLIRMPAFSNRPHFARVATAREWSNMYKSKTRFDTLNGGAGGNEEALLSLVRDQGRLFGRMGSLASMGTYTLGEFYDPPVIEHLGV